MSGFDNSVILSLSKDALASQAALQQSSTAAIELGVAVEILQSQLSVGDLITATVLPPQGGSDRLALLGTTVLAQLPPGVDPGQSLLLQVTGFQGNQILVTNLGVIDPNNPPPTVQVTLPQPAPGAPTQATLSTVLTPAPPPPANPQAPQSPVIVIPSGVEGRLTPQIPPPGVIPGNVAPPRAVFVAASVQPAPPQPTALPPNPPAVQAAALQAELAALQAAVIPSEVEGPPQPQATTQSQTTPQAPGASTQAAALLSAEPELVQAAESLVILSLSNDDPQQQAAPTTQPQSNVPAQPQSNVPAQPQSNVPAQPSAAPPAQQGVTPTPQTVIPSEVEGQLTNLTADIEAQQLTLEARIAATYAAAIDIAELVTTPGTQRTGVPTPQTPIIPPPPTAGAPPATAPLTTPLQQGIAPAEPTLEAALLTRLRIPLLPTTLAAAKLISNAASLLPRALSRLDAALAAVSPQNAQAASLRTILSFVQRLDPANARALPEQLMAYVNNVVDGAESKLANIIRTFLAQEPPASTQQAAAPQPPPSTSPNAPPANPNTGTAQQPAATAAVEPDIALPPAAAAHVAERTLALQYDLKTAMAALAESPPHGAPSTLAPALSEALTTLTAVQLNVLNAQQTDPNAIVIPLPVFYHPNGDPVHLRIARESANGKKLDADNFHIAFILDTKSLGTVAVDLQTSGRAVSANIRTEAAPAADRFRSTLDDLRNRLEQLHYRVSNIAAAVAPHRADAASNSTAADSVSPDASSMSSRAKSRGGVDLRA